MPDADAPYRLDFPAATRVALVGAGFIADFHLEALAETPNVRVVCVCDPDRARAEAVARRFGVERVATSVGELAAVGVQVAHVLAPPDRHTELVRELLEAGIGCFVEKPLALSSKEAKELGARARELRLPLAVNHNALFHPAFVEVVRRVAAGHIGRVEHVRAILSVPLRQLDAQQFGHWMFRAPQNIVFEQAVHPFAQIHALVGAVDESSATLLGTRELTPGQVFHDKWSVVATAERGTVELSMAFGRSFPRQALEVLGTDGMLVADLQHGWVEEERKSAWLDFWNRFLAGSRRAAMLGRSAWRGLWDYAGTAALRRPRQDPFYAGLRASIRSFHARLRAGEPVRCDADEAAAVLRWCEAAAKPAVRAAKKAVAREPLQTGGEPREGEVVVLGASGFIGRATVRALLERDVPVTAAVRRTDGLPAEIAESVRDGRVRLVRARLEDRASLDEAFRGARVVIHLATGNGADWESIERAMIGGSVAAAEAALDAGVQRFVFVSSIAALYLGSDATRRGTMLDDDVPADPRAAERSLYARGKAETERRLLALHAERGLPLVVARPGVVLGAGTPPQHSGLGLWVRDNHCVGWGVGDTPLPLVWVDDVADALARMAVHRGTDLAGKALNLCALAPLTARDVVEEMRRASGRDLRFHARPLALSQTLELGKWVVKRAGGRAVPVPSWRDLKSRQLAPRFTSRTARDVLGWRPVQDRERFLARAVRPMVVPSTDGKSA